MAAQFDLGAQQPADGRTLSVLFLADHFAYTGAISHGVTSYYLNVLPQLAAAGIKVTACFLRESAQGLAPLSNLGIDVIGLEDSRWSLAVLPKVLKLVKSGQYDLIHAAQIKACTLARIVGRLTATPTILHVHDTTLPPWPLRCANRIFGRRQDVGICVSAAVSECASRGYKASKEQQLVLHSGLGLERLQRLRGMRRALRAELLNIWDDRPVIGMVGRFFAVKGHRAFIGSLPGLLASCSDARFVFVGDGPERRACESLAHDLGIANSTEFLGQRQDVAHLMNCFDLTVMPSLSEGLPLVAIESLAAGVPLVGFAVGGIPEVLTDGVTGWLAPAGDMARFAELTARLIGDAELRQTMGAAGRRDAQRFSADRHIAALIDLYRRLCGDALDPAVARRPASG